MSIQLKLSNNSKSSFFVDIEKFPTKVKVPASKSDYLSQIITGIFFTLFGYVLFRSNLPEDSITPNLLFGLAMGTFGGFNLAKAFLGTKGSASLTFHETYVEAKQEYWFTKKKWQTPYPEFKGVKTREGIRPKRGALQPFQIIELIHQDASKTLPLYAKRGSKRQTKLLEDYAEKFNVPVL